MTGMQSKAKGQKAKRRNEERGKRAKGEKAKRRYASELFSTFHTPHSAFRILFLPGRWPPGVREDAGDSAGRPARRSLPSGTLPRSAPAIRRPGGIVDLPRQRRENPAAYS